MRHACFWIVLGTLGLLPGAGCYPDETAGHVGQLRVPLEAAPSQAAFAAWRQALGSEAYRDFDMNLSDHDFFLGLHLLEVVSVDPRQEQELGFGASEIELIDGTEPYLSMALSLPPCERCVFAIRIYLKDAQGVLQAFSGLSNEFGQAQGSLEMDAWLHATGQVDCLDEASGEGVAVAAQDAYEGVRLPLTRTQPGGPRPAALLALPVGVAYRLQHQASAGADWRTFAQVELTYPGQAIEVRFDSAYVYPP
jgi:hypothetical protein